MIRLLCALMCVAMSALAQDDCTFDPQDQLRVLSVVSGLYPHGALDAKERRITWSLQNGGFTTFSYSGCADLGSTIVQQVPLPGARTEKDALAVARLLVRRYWSGDVLGGTLAADTLIAALDASTFTVERNDQGTTYYVSDPQYVELYVIHSFQDGFDRVTVSWQGAF